MYSVASVTDDNPVFLNEFPFGITKAMNFGFVLYSITNLMSGIL